MNKQDDPAGSAKTRRDKFPVPDAEDTNVAHTPKDAELPLPHERDESPGRDDADPNAPREVIEQAARDVARGLRDTDRHGVPSDVPGPGSAPEDSPGADVPPEGVDVANPGGRQRRPK